MKHSFAQKLFAEFIGTFILASVVLVTLTPSTPFPIATPIAAGLALGLCVYLLGGISGCHINPAISMSMLLCRQINLKHFSGYVVAQLLGGLFALFLVTAYVPIGQEHWLFVHKATIFTGSGEALGALFFGFCVMATAYNENISPAISGIVVGVSLLVGLTISHNASYGILNPAVALATKAWNWDYLVIPFIGASVGGFISKFLFNMGRDPASH